jgi:hypothetical protein
MAILRRRTIAIAAVSPRPEPFVKHPAKPDQVVCQRVAILRRERSNVPARQKSRRPRAITLFWVNKNG